jgi:hypothetical protein
MLVVEASIKFVSGLECSTQKGINRERMWCHSDGGPCSQGISTKVQWGHFCGATWRVDQDLGEHH